MYKRFTSLACYWLNVTNLNLTGYTEKKKKSLSLHRLCWIMLLPWWRLINIANTLIVTLFIDLKVSVSNLQIGWANLTGSLHTEFYTSENNLLIWLFNLAGINVLVWSLALTTLYLHFILSLKDTICKWSRKWICKGSYLLFKTPIKAL